MPYRIERSIEGEAIVFALCGEVDDEHKERLQELLDVEKQSERRRRILLNLEDVTLVRREGVEFLARLEASGLESLISPSTFAVGFPRSGALFLASVEAIADR